MSRASLACVGTLLLLFSLQAYPDNSVSLVVKSKQWISISSATEKPTDYYLDVYVVDDKNAQPVVYPRGPSAWHSPKKSPHYWGGISLTGDPGENNTLKLPKGKYVYLSSYFVKNSTFLNPGGGRYCNAMDHFLAEENTYILDVNIIIDGPVSGECITNIYTPKAYASSFTHVKESTAVEGVSRKELSLRYGSQMSARLTAGEIIRTNDYLPVYINAATDRLYIESTSSNKKNAVIAWLARMIGNSGSGPHIATMKEIAAKTNNKYAIKSIKKYLPKTMADHTPYVPKPIDRIGGRTVLQLQLLATLENLKAISKREIEAAARDIVAKPTDYDQEAYALAATRLTELAESKDGSEVSSAIWLTRALQASGQEVYIKTLTEVERVAVHKKLKKSARKAIEALAK